MALLYSYIIFYIWGAKKYIGDGMPRHLGTISAIALCISVPQIVGATTYTREEAVKIALEKSSAVKTAEEDLVSANSQVDAGYGNALPSIDLSATVTRIFGLDDVEALEDLVMASVNSAVKKKDDAAQSSLSDITGGMKIPGLM